MNAKEISKAFESKPFESYGELPENIKLWAAIFKI